MVMNEAAVSLRNIDFAYLRHERLIADFSIELHRGDLWFILGANGSGKSTLGRLMCGLLRPDKGTVWIRGQNPQDAHPRRRILLAYYIPQRTYLHFIRSSLLEEWCLAMSFKKDRLTNNIHDSLLIRLSEYGVCRQPNVHPYDLSVSEAWRFSLLLGSVVAPCLLFIDEIPSLTSTINRNALHRVIGEQTTQGKIVAISTHTEPDLEIKAAHITHL